MAPPPLGSAWVNNKPHPLGGYKSHPPTTPTHLTNISQAQGTLSMTPNRLGSPSLYAIVTSYMAGTGRERGGRGRVRKGERKRKKEGGEREK